MHKPKLTSIERLALIVSADRRMRFNGEYRNPVLGPVLHRQHVDGPYVTFIDGRPHWLSLWERLMVALGIWDAWSIEQRHNPLFEEPRP